MSDIAPKPKLNPTAVLAVVLGGLLSPLALFFGWFAREQIRRSGERSVLLCTIAMSLGALAVVVWLVGGVYLYLWWNTL